MTAASARAVLVGGHECGGHAGIVEPGRRLQQAVECGLAGEPVVVVVPMTFGRDPAMMADAAKTLQGLAQRHPGRVALAAPFGTPDHLVALLRGAARRAGDLGDRGGPAGLIVAARASNPFDDAELHRLAHLVRAHGAGIEVEVALLRDDVDVLTAHDRLRRLGVARSVVVPAGFGPGPALPGDDALCAGLTADGPLLSETAIARVVAARVDTARHVLVDHRDDGIAAGLVADHEHGYAHTHTHTHEDAGAPAEQEGHGHAQAALRARRW
ncbi:MAG: hypothetical protein QM733_21740 [Ilumatobacteraceae bacterium]